MTFDPLVFLSQMVTFGVLVFIMWRFAWGPIAKHVSDRQAEIRKSIESAEQTRQAVAKLEEQYRARLEEIQQKSAELVTLAKVEAARTREDLLKAAQKEADDVRTRGMEQLALERRQLATEIRAEIVKLSIAVTEKAIGEKIDAAIHRRRFEELLASIESQRAEGKNA
jgi:F-type H+-transporting ATPase subunit b